MILPLLSIVIPTRNRLVRLRRTLEGLHAQIEAPAEVLVIDAGDDAMDVPRLAADLRRRGLNVRVTRAHERGAAPQRNQGVALARGTVIGFCDDDLDFEPGCLGALREFLVREPGFGGVSATIVNQAPHGFGRLTKVVVGMMDSTPDRPLDGRVVGPALNFLPTLRDDGPPVCETQWLNTTCTLYRREALPTPPFDALFHGYSMMEDLCLSLRVGERSRLAVLRAARVVHDTQPGEHKRDPGALGAMSVRNRYYVATRVLGRAPRRAWFQLAVWQTFCAVAGARRPSPHWWKTHCGALSALADIARGGR